MTFRRLAVAFLLFAGAFSARPDDASFQVPSCEGSKPGPAEVERLLTALPSLAKAFPDEKLPVLEPCASQTNLVGGAMKYLMELKEEKSFEAFAKERGYANGKELLDAATPILAAFYALKLEEVKPDIDEARRAMPFFMKPLVDAQGFDKQIANARKAVPAETFAAVKAKKAELEKAILKCREGGSQ